MDNLDDILPDIEAGIEDLIDTLNNLDTLKSIDSKLEEINKD